MKSLPWFGLIVVAVMALTASAEITLSRSDDAVVLENALVRVELQRDRNFQPSVLVDKRSAQQSFIDDVGFSAWEVPRADWITSATCDWVVSIKTHEDDKAAWCETTLVRELPNTEPSRLTLRTTLRPSNSISMRGFNQSTFIRSVCGFRHRTTTWRNGRRLGAHRTLN
ncbi:MAG: hypothetical protein CMJ64_17370 [Planctomycetaceae bacterium]|jgi:hypothetical protein|nr:hypothetical protein [Planctomycetaceae bacterium]